MTIWEYKWSLGFDNWTSSPLLLLCRVHFPSTSNIFTHQVFGAVAGDFLWKFSSSLILLNQIVLLVEFFFIISLIFYYFLFYSLSLVAFDLFLYCLVHVNHVPKSTTIVRAWYWQANPKASCRNMWKKERKGQRERESNGS